MRRVEAKGLKSDNAAKSADFIRPVNLITQCNKFFSVCFLKKFWMGLIACKYSQLATVIIKNQPKNK